MAKRTISIPDDQDKHVWKAWERLAEQVTPPMPTTYTMRPSTLFTLIGQKAHENPGRVLELIKQIIQAEDW